MNSNMNDMTGGAASTKQPFAVIAKPVGSKCNMRCSYCYYLEKQEAPLMSDRVLEQLIIQTIKSSPGPVVSFTWHGGEPTIAGMEFYKKAVALQKKHLPRGWEAWNNLQTNGLMLNDKWCSFLAANKFDVGLSLDGSRMVHDKNRKDRLGKGTYDRIVNAAQRLKKAGIQPDLLCTVTADSAAAPQEVYNGLRALGTGWAQFIPVVVRFSDGSFSPQSVTPEAYGRFLCAAFDLWATHDLGIMDIQLFAETARVWAGGQPALCWMTESCGRVLVAEADGSIYSCDHFVDGEHRLGDLLSGDLQQLDDGAQQTAFGQSKRSALTAQCRRCPWLSCCGGGCLKDRFALSEDGEPGHYYLCASLKAFFEHAHAPMQRMMAMSRSGMKPAQIMNRMREELNTPQPAAE